MFFSKKMRFRCSIPHLDLQVYWTELYRTCFALRGRNRCRTSNSPILNIFIRFKENSRQTLNWTEIRPNFARFWPLKFFGEVYPKFRLEIIKSNILRSTVQNFAPIGRRSSKITRREKKTLKFGGKAQRESARRPKSD